MKLSGSKNWVKSADLKGGEKIIFLNEGEWIESTMYKYPDGTPQKQFVIKVKLNGEEKDMSLNKTNRTAMIEAYGDDTANWIGKWATVGKMKALVSGKMMDVVVLDIGTAPVDEASEEGTEESSVPF